MNTLILSDIHLGSRSVNTDALLSLLKDKSFDRYILVGDIIDGWLFKKYKKFSSSHTQVIKRFLKLSRKKEIIWIAGNHDEFLRKYLPLEIGNIKIVDEFIEDGVWYSHGDHFDGIVKLRWLGYLGTWGYDLAIQIDQLMKRFGYKRSLSKYLKNNVKAAVSFITDFENEMVRQAKLRSCHTVVCGHVHSPISKKIDNVTYINLGDWIENSTFAIKLGEKNVQLMIHLYDGDVLTIEQN